MAVKRCAHCGGKFGLIRRMAYRLGSIIQFCSKKCERDYYAKLHLHYLQRSRWNAISDRMIAARRRGLVEAPCLVGLLQ